MKNRSKNNYNNSNTELKDIVQCQRVITVWQSQADISGVILRITALCFVLVKV